MQPSRQTGPDDSHSDPSQQSLTPLDTITLDEVSSYQFPENSVMAELYESSRAQGGGFYHYEGAAAVLDLRELVNSYSREQGLERVSEEVLARRMAAVIKFAETVLDTMPEVEGVIWWGSSLRGKPDPGDFDIRLVGPHEANYWEPLDSYHQTQTQKRIMATFESSETLPTEIEGKPVSVIINSSFKDTGGRGLNTIEEGPYMAFLRSNRDEQTHHGPLKAFFNAVGTGYLQYRKP